MQDVARVAGAAHRHCDRRRPPARCTPGGDRSGKGGEKRDRELPAHTGQIDRVTDRETADERHYEPQQRCTMSQAAARHADESEPSIRILKEPRIPNPGPECLTQRTLRNAEVKIDSIRLNLCVL